MLLEEVKIGTIVTLKGDHSVRLTINSGVVDSPEVYKGCIYCIWFNDEKILHGGYFHLEALEVEQSKF